MPALLPPSLLAPLLLRRWHLLLQPDFSTPTLNYLHDMVLLPLRGKIFLIWGLGKSLPLLLSDLCTGFLNIAG